VISPAVGFWQARNLGRYGTLRSLTSLLITSITWALASELACGLGLLAKGNMMGGPIKSIRFFGNGDFLGFSLVCWVIFALPMTALGTFILKIERRLLSRA
jgi:hypothetical protein